MLLLNTHDEILLETARCFVDNNYTVRKVAKELGTSKSTAHKRLRDFVEKAHVNEQEAILACQVTQLLNKNYAEKHIRGGRKTKEKFHKLRLG